MCLAAVAELVAVLLAPLRFQEECWYQQYQPTVFQILHLSHAALPHLELLCPQHHELSGFAATYCNGCK